MSSDTRVNRNIFMARELAVVHAKWGGTAASWELSMRETRGLHERGASPEELAVLYPSPHQWTRFEFQPTRAGYIQFPSVLLDVVWLSEPADEAEQELVIAGALKMVYRRMLGTVLGAMLV